MSFPDHDFVLASLAQGRIDAALAEAARERLAREARQPPEEAGARPGGAAVLTPARSETR